MTKNISIIIPAKNEAVSLKSLLSSLIKKYHESEIIVDDDGSTDNTEELCKQHKIICVRHLYSKGNGAAIKSGSRKASRDVIVFMDADGRQSALLFMTSMLIFLIGLVSEQITMLLYQKSNDK